MKLPAIKLPFSPKTLNIIVLIFGVLILAAILYYSCANREGFDGSVPKASQTSSIPSDVPGATSSNPTIAKPQAKDIQAALDEAESFFILAATIDYRQSTLPIETKHDIAIYRRLIKMIQTDLKKALAQPESSKLTLKDVTDIREKFTELLKVIRSNIENSKPDNISDTNFIKLGPIQKQALIKRIEEFMKYLPKSDLNQKIKESNMDILSQMKLAYYSMEGPEYKKKLESDEISAEEGAYLEKMYIELIPHINLITNKEKAESGQLKSYETTVVAGKPGVITLKELQNLVSRIEEEQLRLANLRSTSATLQARQAQLEKLAADVRDLIGKVQREEMKLEDVPISTSTAEAFMKQIDASEQSTLPPLIEPRAKIADGLEARITPSPFTGDMNVQALHGLLDSAKYLKWNLDVKLEYDPKLAARDNLLKRLEGIEQRLSALAVSETPISKQMYEVFMKELQTINNIIAPEGNDNKKSNHASVQPQTAYTRISSSGDTAEYPSLDQLTAATHVRDTASGNAILNPSKQVSPDVFIRPGFVMNDDTIRRRASSSAFDDSLVGGADYKKRSQDLCRQIRGANLGEPDQFGCIANPESVSPDYSWKGNFTMVCNRLGDTWGGWYPEMFGCPKYDPTQKFRATMM